MIQITTEDSIPAGYIDLDTLVEWAGNYNDGDVGRIFEAIKRYGYNRTVSVWTDNVVMAGNHTMKALKLLRLNGVQPPGKSIIQQGDKWYVQYTDMSHLDESEALGYAIADNRLASMATHDDDRLLDYLLQIQERGGDDALLATGYDDDALEYLMGLYAENQPEFDGGGAAGSSGDDLGAVPAPEANIKMFQLYLTRDNYQDFYDRVVIVGAAMGLDNPTDTIIKLVNNAYHSSRE